MHAGQARATFVRMSPGGISSRSPCPTGRHSSVGSSFPA
ncbi:hypothetical protein A176_005722 [Myxococcus hansupus]|uniref:Uncharacterized protein n=1 Tax=Pseudomyxococcus hansupus TaxID=1297742 RepID=A0A0H4X5C7_9BACT|nr:hypothetical protein A176_005722 [Myxococcus hansupus]